MSDTDRPRVGQYRYGDHNPRNIYRAGTDRDSDEHVGVAFTPEMGRLVVTALNAYLEPTLRWEYWMSNIGVVWRTRGGQDGSLERWSAHMNGWIPSSSLRQCCRDDMLIRPAAHSEIPGQQSSCAEGV